MALQILFAWLLVLTTATIHSAGLAFILILLRRSPASRGDRLWQIAYALVRTVFWLIAFHILEIAVWGFFFWWQKCLPNAEVSFYFSGVTYATIGYGDVILPKEWRLFGPLEGLTGILMCGASTAFFFAVLSSRYLRQHLTTR